MCVSIPSNRKPVLNSRHGINLPALAAQLECRNPVALKAHPQSITCRVDGPDGRSAILKVALGRGGKRVLKKEWTVLNNLRFEPPAAVPKILGWRGDALLMEAIEVPRFDADAAKEVLGSEEIQQKLENLLLQIQRQVVNVATRWSVSGKRTPLVFSHGDLSERNLLIDPNAESIYLIDFQEADLRLAGYDLIHLCHHARQPLEEWGWQKKLFVRVWPKLYPDAKADWAMDTARGIFVNVAKRHLRIDRYLSKTNPAQRSAYEEGIRARRANLELFNSETIFLSWYRRTLDG